MARLRWALSINGLIGLLAIFPVLAITLRLGPRRQRMGADLLRLLDPEAQRPRAGDEHAGAGDRQRARDARQRGHHLHHGAGDGRHRDAHAGARRQPKPFGNIPEALWWAVVTLTTTGYGDVVPQTVGGKMVGSLVMVSGILVLALMTGILATGFAEEERRREYLRVWDQVTQGADVHRARHGHPVGDREQAPRAPLSAAHRRGAPRRAGRFDVLHLRGRGRGPPAARLGAPCGQGGFFGEMALLDRLPRSATVVTTQPTTLLVLYASDFYEVAANIPSLVDAVEREAQRRRAENQGGEAGAPGQPKHLPGHWPGRGLSAISRPQPSCRSSPPSSWSAAPASACGRCRARACPSSSCPCSASNRPSSRPCCASPTAACSAGR